jgi:hypothetical protein
MRLEILKKDRTQISLLCSWFSNISTRFENDFLIYVPHGLSPCPENRKVICKMADVLCFQVTVGE